VSFHWPIRESFESSLPTLGPSTRMASLDVMLRRRRLGSVEENFIKQLKIGDLFVLGG